MIARAGSAATTAQQQALAAADSIITAQASVLSFEHAFQVLALAILGMLVCVPFLRRPKRGAAPAGH